MIQKYNTEVRKAISDEYIRCSKERAEIQKRIVDLKTQLSDDGEELTHSQYLKSSRDLVCMNEKVKKLSIELNVWDQAREICLNVIDRFN